jgi:hypothetical protein
MVYPFWIKFTLHTKLSSTSADLLKAKATSVSNKKPAAAIIHIKMLMFGRVSH